MSAGGWRHTDSGTVCAVPPPWKLEQIVPISSLFFTSSVCDVEPICLPGRCSKDPYLLPSSAVPRSVLSPFFVCESEAPPKKKVYLQDAVVRAVSFPLLYLHEILRSAKLLRPSHFFSPLSQTSDCVPFGARPSGWTTSGGPRGRRKRCASRRISRYLSSPCLRLQQTLHARFCACACGPAPPRCNVCGLQISAAGEKQ